MTGKIISMLCLCLVVQSAWASVSLSPGSGELSRSGMPKSMSGLAYAGGTTFYTIAESEDATGEVESWCLYKMSITTSEDGKTITSARMENAGVPLQKCTDVEAVAYDPASGHIWASDETKLTIGEYDPETGKVLRYVEFPEFFKDCRRGFWCEGLTISGDGLTMWAANEEALVCDGVRSSYQDFTVVRLVKFTRETVRDDWRCVAMYPYKTAKWHQQYSYGEAGRRGVSELVALPDGSLLVLERELSASSSGTGVWAGLSVKLYLTVYRITPTAFSAATNVVNVDALSKVTGWASVSKELLWTGEVGWANYEGCCLAGRISDAQCSLIAVSDAGDNDMLDAKIKPFVLSGLDIHTLDFLTPACGVSSIVGANYRYLKGEEVRVGLSGTVSEQPYATDGTTLAACNGWEAPNQLPAKGSDEAASFVVEADGQFAWSVQPEVAMKGYHLADSFESYVTGADVRTAGGWYGDENSVKAQTYLPPTPPGYAMARESHTKILDTMDGSVGRALDGCTSEDDRLEAMVCFSRGELDLPSMQSDVLVSVAAGPDGRLHLWHSFLEDGTWREGWIPLSDKVYQDGEWLRIEAEFDNLGDPHGRAVVRVKINGSCQPTVHGIRSPSDTTPYGAWYYLAGSGCQGVALTPRELTLSYTKVDDFMLVRKTVEPEHDGPTSIEGIDFSWFDKAGLPRDPGFAAPFIPGHTLGDVYEAGIDPYSERPLEFVDFRLGEHGVVSIEFNGYKGEDPAGYQMLYSTTPDFTSPVVLQPTDGKFNGDAATWTTTWEGKIPDDATNSGFYLLRAVR